jgi:hypothetical protein
LAETLALLDETNTIYQIMKLDDAFFGYNYENNGCKIAAGS